MDGLMDFLMFALPGGFIGSIFTWFVGRRKQNNGRTLRGCVDLYVTLRLNG